MSELTDEERAELIARTRADSALWRAEACAAHARVSDELARARGQLPAHFPQEAIAAEIAIVQGDLDSALLAMVPPGPIKDDLPGPRLVPRRLVRIGRALKLYYSGARIERTWAGIHRASTAMYMLYDEAELPAQATNLLELVAALPDRAAQLRTLTNLVAKVSSELPGPRLQVRSVLRETYQEAIGASDALQIEARVLRNAMLVGSGVLFLLVIAVGVVHFLDTSIISVCSVTSKGTVCPTEGSGSSHPFDVFAVELAGLLGGMLSVVIPLATGERIKTPYRVFNHQLLLKVLAGAATAVAGVVLVESEFISALTLKNANAIIGYAIFFGFAQQALTGVVDRRVSSLAKQTAAPKDV